MARGARRVKDRVTMRGKSLKCRRKSVNREPSFGKGKNINGTIGEKFVEKSRFVKIRGD